MAATDPLTGLPTASMTRHLAEAARTLPVAAVLGEVERALAIHGAAVLVAPPGAGKTTLVPLQLLDAPWLAGHTILMLEPRRLAARLAAGRMAELLGEPPGGTVGYAVRFERRRGPSTRLEVVTEGLATRRLQDDPELTGVGLVILDEFHERSLDADLALALTLDVRASLRPDLRVLVMSATLDAAPVASLLGEAPVVRSEGRSFPVGTVHLGTAPERPVERRMAEAVRQALAETRETGGAGPSVLAFLPGAREIRRTAELLGGSALGPDVIVAPLMGELSRAEQDRALRPAPPGRRKVVLATDIAETSLTIEGIGVVVDSGLARRPVFSPRTGMTRLETRRIALASAEQRHGRAGRLGPGVCYRLWSEAEERAMRPHDLPEIVAADLAPLVLELAAWGVADPAGLAWLTPPPAAAVASARALLGELGALDDEGRITAHGRAMARLPLHPRLAHMLLAGCERGDGATALGVAALLSARDPWRTSRDPDLAHRLSLWRHGVGDRGALYELERVRRQLARLLPEARGESDERAVGRVLALAYPDRIARRRGRPGAYLLTSGRGALLDAADPLAAAEWLAIAELDDAGADARTRLAAALDETEVLDTMVGRIATREEVGFDRDSGTVLARRVTRLGAIVLREQPLDSVPSEAYRAALLEAVRAGGPELLPWTPAARGLRARLAFLHRHDPERWPDVSDTALLTGLDEWLAPWLDGCRSLADLAKLDTVAILAGLVGHARRAELERLAPARFTTPAGSSLAIDYAPDPPVLAVRLQELFGLAEHPSVLDGRVPLSLHLLSPAGRPLQVTQDLPGFWRGSYALVRKEMRGRYPKHPWPENPLAAPPTRRAKPR